MVPEIKRIQQRYNNDCSIACVAMYLNLTYEEVLKITIEQHDFMPNGMGINVGDLFLDLGYQPRFKHKKIIQDTCVVSIPSLNFPNKFHAVVLNNNKIIDPSNLIKAELDYVLNNVSWSYWVKEKENE